MNTTTLTRSLGLRFVVVVTVANILGSGVYKKVAPMANELGSPECFTYFICHDLTKPVEVATEDDRI